MNNQKLLERLKLIKIFDASIILKRKGNNKKHFIWTKDEYDCLWLSRCRGALPAPKLTQLVKDHANKSNLDLSSDVVAVYQ